MGLSKKHIYLIIILVACFASYFNILFNGFAWDDEAYIQNRVDTRTFSGAISNFGKDSYGIYRPIREMAYYFSYKMFGLNPVFYHLLSILFHFGVCVLLFFIIRELFSEKVAFFSSVLFAVLPIHVERVANTTASFDLIGILFYLLSFYLYILFRKKHVKWMFYLSLIFFVFGLFSSEEIFTLPLLVIAYEIIFNRKIILKSLYYFIPLVLFLLFRTFVIKVVQRVSEYPGGSSLVTFLTMPRVILDYLVLTFYPVGLTPFRGIDFVYGFFDIWFLIPFFVIIFLIYLAYKYRAQKEVLFFSVFFLIAMLPFLNITPLQKIIAERYFYLASFAVIGLFSLFFVFIESKNRNIMWGVFILISVAFISFTLYNNTFWKDDFTLMSRGVQLNPYDSKAHDNLGSYYFRINDLKNAEYHFRQAVTNSPQDYTAWTNLGVLYSKTGEYDNSLYAFNKAIEITPYNYDAYDKLGILFMDVKDYKQSEKAFLRALYYEENYVPALSHIGVLYGKMENLTLAASYLQKAVAINPYHAESYYNLGMLLKSIGKDADAEKFLNKARELDSSYK